ncbi:putative ribonuclease H-like domain-containing protein [Tanacetum coccineum]
MGCLLLGELELSRLLNYDEELRGDLLEDDIENLKRSERFRSEDMIEMKKNDERMAGPKENRVKVAEKEETGKFRGSPDGEIVARRANDCIVSITEPDYKNLNKNDIKDIYLLIMNGKKVNLTAPTITFLGIEEHDMFSIIYELAHGIIYKNSKKKKRVMRHIEIHKFCDTTLNRVLEGLKSYNNDVKYGYVQKDLTKDETEYLKLFEEETAERLKHRRHMRRWEIKPALGFMRPFRCPVIILNTIDYLGKFDGKADEGFFIGYSINSKAFRVFNSRTRIVVENLHVQFSENTPNFAGSTKACDDAGKARMETIPSKDYIVLPLWTADPPFSQSSKSSPDARFKPSGDDEKKVTKKPGKEGGDPSKEDKRDDQKKDASVNSTNNVNAASTNEVNAIGRKASIELTDEPNMTALEEIIYSDDDEDVGAEADMNNLDAFMPVSPIPTIRVHKNHQVEQIIGDLNSIPQTRRMTKNLEEHSKIEEEVYVCQPPGFKDPNFPYKVYKVEKRGKIDKTLFIRRDKGNILLVQVYVDDIIFGSTKKSLCTEFEKMIHKKFQMSSMGELTFFLGLQLKQKEDGIFISQDKYVTEILKKFGFTDVKTASTPMETQNPLLKDEDGEEVDVHLYRSMIGSLMYLTSLRPDIMFAVCTLKGQPKFGLWYPKDSPFDLVAYTDSDYAGASLDIKSITGGCKFLGCRLISWQYKKQTVVANSIIQAEYVAASSCCGQRLEKKGGSRTHGLKRLCKVGRSARVIYSDEASLGDQEDASKQGRIADIDADAGINLVSTHFDADIYMFRVHDLVGDEVVVETEVSSKDVNLSVDEVTLAQSLATLKSAKPKADKVMLQEPEQGTITTTAATTVTVASTRPKAKGLVIHEEEQATTLTVSSQQPSQLKLQAELDEEVRLAREKAEKEEEANIVSWDNVQAMIDVDYQMAQQMQAEEQEKLRIEEKSKLFVQLLEARKKHVAAMRAQEERNKPPTKSQKRNTMSTYLKNMAGYKHNQLKNKRFDDIMKLFDKAMKMVNTFIDMETELVEGSKVRAKAEIA